MARAVPLVSEHRGQYPNLTAAAEKPVAETGGMVKAAE